MSFFLGVLVGAVSFAALLFGLAAISAETEARAQHPGPNEYEVWTRRSGRR